jgi:hypothetical protein
MFTRGGLRPTKAALGDDERRVQMPLSRRTLWIGTALLILAAIIVVIAVYSGGGGSGY